MTGCLGFGWFQNNNKHVTFRTPASPSHKAFWPRPGPTPCVTFHQILSGSVGSRWWQLKYLLFPPSKLGKWSNLTFAYFSNQWFNHQLGVNEVFSMRLVFHHNFLLFVGSLEAQKLMENSWGLVLPSLWPMPAMKRPFGEAINRCEYPLNA